MSATRSTATETVQLALPRLADLGVAFVYLHAQQGPDFFADVPFCWAAGELRALGVAADVVHARLPRGDPAAAAPLIDELIATIGRLGHGLVVFEHLWLADLVSRMQSELGALVCETDANAVLAGQRVDFRLRWFVQHRQPLLDLVAALRAGTDLMAVRNLVAWPPEAPAPLTSRRQERFPAEPDWLRAFCPITDAIEIGGLSGGSDAPLRKTLDTNSGCPYARDVRRNPHFADLDLDALDPVYAVTLKGCSFCELGGDYRALTADQSVAVHVAQIGWYQRHLGRLDEVVLRDQSAIRYLPELIAACVEEGLAPLGFLVPARGDAILRDGERLEAAARAAAGSGNWFTLYLIGFESFSQSQLDLYNKGVSVAEYAAALAQMRDLRDRWPGVYRMEAYGASSFILFNPWTRLEDLDETVAFCKDHGAHQLAHGWTLTRLRLQPHLPLYWRARADGLIVDSAPHADRGAAFTGYGGESAWRYREARVGVIEDAERRLARHVRVDESVGLLDTVLDWARARWPDADAPASTQDGELEALEAAWQTLRGQWRPQDGVSGSGAGTRDAGPLQITLASPHSDPVAAPPVGLRAPSAGRTILLGDACNNRCRTCLGEHGRYETGVARLRAAVEAAARRHGRVVLAGREPTLQRALPRLIRAARAAGASRIELVSNGRALAASGVIERLAAAGLTTLLLKRHRLADSDEDRYAQAQGAGAQLWLGLARLAQVAPHISWTLLLVPTRDAFDEAPALVERAAAAGASAVQIQVRAGEAPLAHLAAFGAAVTAARRRAAELGLRVDVDGF